MPRLATLLLLAAFAATPPPSLGTAVPGVDVTAVRGCRSSGPESHRAADSSRPLDPAQAEAHGAGLGLPRRTETSRQPPAAARALTAARPESTHSEAFHLRERTAHPANAPPSPA